MRRCILLGLLLLLPLVAGAGERGVAPRSFTIRLAFDTHPSHPSGIAPHRLLRRPRVALVLSGGGARGTAQIGVLKAFERHHIPIDFIAATSMGAIVGGLYASGYTADEIEQIALTTNWDDVLSLGEETKRTELFVDQKLARDRTFLAVRFQGLEPVIPGAVSTGQRLTDFLSDQTLQAIYHPHSTFDDLKIPFRAVATDLLSGNRVVIGDGSLAEAIRASATTPLLYSPIVRDTMRLIDGGLLANVPVDVAREKGYDVVIAINTTSGLRTADEMRAPWETVDQLMGISMQSLNNLQLKNADIVITPDIGRHLSYDLRGLDSLIARGEQAAEEKIDEVQRLLRSRMNDIVDSPDTPPILTGVTVGFTGGAVSDSLWATIAADARAGVLSLRDIRRHLTELYNTGLYSDVWAEVEQQNGDAHVRFVVVPNPVLKRVEVAGCAHIPVDSVQAIFAPMIGSVIRHDDGVKALEDVLRTYRRRGYSLANIDSVLFDAATGTLRLTVNEGTIHVIRVEGGVRSKDPFVLREFPLQEGDIFQIDRARRGITNISSTTLFEFVYLEVGYEDEQPALIIRLKERPTQLVRLGLRIDNERYFQGSVDIRDENFHGRGTELGFTATGGNRNSDFVLEYKIHRLFGQYLTFSANTFYRTRDAYLFSDGPVEAENRWDRIVTGEYRDIRYGGGILFGSQLERLGNATVEYQLQDVRIRNLRDAQPVEERYRLATVRVGSVVDSKDRYPFPTRGVGLQLSYEFAVEALGSEVAYNAVRFMYEGYTTWGGRHTLHPRFTMGFADRTMPFSQQFRLGGRDSFFGLREDDRRGRQLMLVNLEYRYLLPVRLLFDTYLQIRYDLCAISAVPEEIKFSTFRHGLGAELALNTPVGAASFGVGRSFHLGKNLPNNPLQYGPVLFYFVVGYDL